MKIWIPLIFTACAFCEEPFSTTPFVQPYGADSIPIDPPIQSKNTYLFGSLSVAPGAGVSIRSRNGAKGIAKDCKIGVTILPLFDTTKTLPVPSIDYNWIHFTKAHDETSPYFSYGIGISYLPYIPLHVGIEHRLFFIDAGAKMLFGLIPSPEIRAGYNLQF